MGRPSSLHIQSPHHWYCNIDRCSNGNSSPAAPVRPYQSVVVKTTATLIARTQEAWQDKLTPEN